MKYDMEARLNYMNKASLIDMIDVSTRRERRAAMGIAVDILGKIRLAEEGYRDRIPENMQSGEAYSAADETVEIIDIATEYLLDAF